MSDAAFRNGMRTVMGDPVRMREWLGTLSPAEFYALNEAADEESERRTADALAAALGRVGTKGDDMAAALREMGRTVSHLGHAMRQVDIRANAALRVVGSSAQIAWNTARNRRRPPTPLGMVSVAPSAPSAMTSTVSAPVAGYSEALSVWPPPHSAPFETITPADAASSVVAEAIAAAPQPTPPAPPASTDCIHGPECMTPGCPGVIPPPDDWPEVDTR